MARIRSIKPEFWANDKLSTVSLEAHYLAAALLNYADDEGYFNANVRLIAADCCPLRDDVSSNIRRALDELSIIDYIRLAEGSDGRMYGWVVNFKGHQKVDRPSPSRIKGLAAFDEHSTNDRRAIDEPSSPDQGSGIRDQGSISSAAKPVGRGVSDDPDWFSDFYTAFPSHPGRKNRADALKAWNAIKPKVTAELAALIMAGLEKAKAAYQRDHDIRKDGWRFFPGPGPWLRARSWEAEYDPPLPTPGNVNVQASFFAPATNLTDADRETLARLDEIRRQKEAARASG